MEWNCRLLVATTDSQMTIFLMGMQRGKLRPRENEEKEIGKNKSADT